MALAKPYTAVTVQVDRLTQEQFEVDDLSGIVDLIDVIKLQSTGPTEAARAIRKKLKYGNVHKQLRALTILDGLIQNAGPRFQRTFADEPLLERLRVAGCVMISDDEVKKKCRLLFKQWAVSYKSTPGMERIASLYEQLPQRKQPVRKEQSKALRETEVETDSEQYGHNVSTSGGGSPPKSRRTPSSPTTPTFSSSSRSGSVASSHLNFTGGLLTKQAKADKTSKKSKTKPFAIEKEKPAILQTIASSSLASTNLMNTMKLINRENQRVSENADAVRGFDNCKKLRRQVLAYLQHVESGDLLGGLLHANDELVEALMAYEILDKSLEDDSDSEDDLEEGSASKAKQVAYERMAGLSIGGDAKAPAQAGRPSFMPMPPANGKANVKEDEEEEDDAVEEDENDPFADRNAVVTPMVEKSGMTWRDV
ncbi:putative actin patch assembly and actin polymerization protein [Lambiella insularis]|nr:putative actin patch assembly and actin polymerization protein [Lambiella insularis]